MACTNVYIVHCKFNDRQIHIRNMKIQGVQVQLYFYNFKFIYSNKYFCTYDTNIKIETILYDDLHPSEVCTLTFLSKDQFWPTLSIWSLNTRAVTLQSIVNFIGGDYDSWWPLVVSQVCGMPIVFNMLIILPPAYKWWMILAGKPGVINVWRNNE